MGTVGHLLATVCAFFGWKNPDRLSHADTLFLANSSGGYGDLLSECARLRDRARRAGVELDDTPGSLDALDHLLLVWRAHPDVAAWLPIEAGSYLGTVIIRTLPGAGWCTAANGRPVVQLRSGAQVDVLGAASTGLAGPGTLTATYQRARDS
jgi:hypothetical protein